MPLVLQPSIDSVSREELEAHIEAVRSRRLLATVEFYTSKNEKLEGMSDKIRDRLKKEWAMLAKEIDQLDRIDAKVSDRLVKIEGLKQEIGLIGDQMVEVET